MDTVKAKLDKTIVITGATSGIGLAAAEGLAGLGARVIATGRSQSRCDQAEAFIRKACPDADISYLTADLASQKQVRELASRITQKVREDGHGAIDVLVNNAGTVSSWYVSTEDGFELQFAVNHLAPFLLTNELMPLLEGSQDGRVVTVSSGSHYRTKLRWDDILMRKHYNCLMAYKQTKLANVLFTSELNRRLGPEKPVRAYAVDPGLVNTDIGLKGTSGIVQWFWKKRSSGGVKPEAAASTILYLASCARVPFPYKAYWKDCCPCPPSSYSQREDMAARLWELSERMCGMKSRTDAAPMTVDTDTTPTTVGTDAAPITGNPEEGT